MTDLYELGRRVLRTGRKQLSITAIAATIGLGLSWYQFLDIRGRNQLIEFHNDVGLALLEHGYYQRAARAFEDVLALDSGDEFAVHGLLIGEMFLEFKELDWDPSAGWLMQQNLETLGIDDKFQHFLLKYRGDVERNLGDLRAAQNKYQEALAIFPNYVDALYSDGWVAYSETPNPNIDRMMKRFSAQIKAAPRDYRGYHGYGYALYMRALLFEPHSTERQESLQLAASQSETAARFKFQLVSTVADLGEIARAVAPHMSAFYHERALKIVEDPLLMELDGNMKEGRALVVRLLHEERQRDTVYLASKAEIQAWIKYQLALDYYSLFVGSKKTDNSYEEEYLRILGEARALDKDRIVLDIFEDQKAILEDSISVAE